MKQVITGFQEVQDRERLSIEGGYEGPNTSGATVALRVLQDTGGPDGYRRYVREQGWKDAVNGVYEGARRASSGLWNLADGAMYFLTGYDG